MCAGVMPGNEFPLPIWHDEVGTGSVHCVEDQASASNKSPDATTLPMTIERCRSTCRACMGHVSYNQRQPHLAAYITIEAAAGCVEAPCVKNEEWLRRDNARVTTQYVVTQSKAMLSVARSHAADMVAGRMLCLVEVETRL